MEERDPKKSLLVLVTELQVYAFDLSQTFHIAIGRHESNDLHFESRTVSNYHAEILEDDGKLVVRDLGSTNGTHVNDESVRRHVLTDGDRIRVGSHTLTMHLEAPIHKSKRFVPVQQDPESFGPGTSGKLVSIRVDSDDALQTLQAPGRYDASLPDLLKILCTNEPSVILSLDRRGEKANVWIRRHRIVHAEYGTALGEKALYRLFNWLSATYEVTDLPEAPSVRRTIDLPTDTLVVEGMRQAVDLAGLVGQLPPLEVPLRLKEDCPLPLSAYTPAELEIFQSTIRHESIAGVLEALPLPDVRILRLIESLIRKGVFEVPRGAESATEETFTSHRIAP